MSIWTRITSFWNGYPDSTRTRGRKTRAVARRGGHEYRYDPFIGASWPQPRSRRGRRRKVRRR